jgi:hypothetical protein
MLPAKTVRQRDDAIAKATRKIVRTEIVDMLMEQVEIRPMFENPFKIWHFDV